MKNKPLYIVAIQQYDLFYYDTEEEREVALDHLRKANVSFVIATLR